MQGDWNKEPTTFIHQFLWKQADKPSGVLVRRGKDDFLHGPILLSKKRHGQRKKGLSKLWTMPSSVEEETARQVRTSQDLFSDMVNSRFHEKKLAGKGECLSARKNQRGARRQK